MRWGSTGSGRRAATTAVLLGLAVWLASCAAGICAADEGEVSIAVAAGQPELAPVAALVEVGLSQQGVRLVERAEIDRILQEQELNAGGLADRAALVKVGRLLRADAFLLLSVEEPLKKEGEEQKPGLLRMRLTETVHGIRLLDWYAAWEPEKAEGAAAQVVQEVSGPLAKLSLPAGDLIPVGMVDVHRVLLGEEHEWLCRALKTMVSSRLSKEPRIVVLEREDLALLQEEKGLTEGAQDAFWSSGVLVEGTLERTGVDKMELRLQIRPAGGEPRDLAAVPVDPEATAQAAEQAAAAVVGGLTNAPPAGTWNLEQEAEAFLRQGELLTGLRRYEAAIPVLETAFAMRPASITCGRKLFEAVDRAWAGLHGLYSDMEEAELAGRLTYVLQDAMRGGGEWDADTSWLSMALSIYMASPESKSNERVVELNRAPRRIVADLQRRRTSTWLAQRGRLPDKYRMATMDILRTANTSADALRGIQDYARANVLPADNGSPAPSFQERCDACMGFVDGMTVALGFPTLGNVVTDDDAALSDLFAIFADLARSDDHLARLTGLILCTSDVRRPPRSGRAEWNRPVDAKACGEQALALFEREFRTRPDISPAAAGDMRRNIRTAIARTCTVDEEVAHMERLCAPLIESGDVAGLLAWDVGQGFRGVTLTPPYDPAKAETAARWAALEDKMAGVLEAGAAQEDVGGRLGCLRADSVLLRQRLRSYVERLEDSARHGKASAPAGDSRQQISRVLQYLPDLMELAAPAGRPAVRVLVHGSDWPRAWGANRWDELDARTFLDGNVLWVCIVKPGKDRLVGLAGIDLSTATVLALWQTVVHGPTTSAALSGLAVGPEHSYIAIRDVGLVEFPGTEQTGRDFLEAPRVLTEADGLPPARIDALAACGEKLWVGCGAPEPGLGTYDPRTRRWETAFSSAVRGDTPLQRGGRYHIVDMAPVGDDLLFIANPSGQRGVWRLRSGSDRPEYLGPPYETASRFTTTSEGIQIHLMGGLAQVSLVENELRLLLVGASSWRYFDPRGAKAWAIRDVPFLKGPPEAGLHLGYYGAGGVDLLYGALRGDEVWAPLGETQIAILRRGKTAAEAELIPNDILDGVRALRFVSTPCGIVAIGQASVGLVAGAP